LEEAALMAEPRKIESRVGDLCVFFSCHHHVLSMPARRIERLVLSEEVRVCRTKASAGPVPVIQAGQVRFAAWNLGRMVEMPTAKGAWILLRITHEGAELPLALGVGQCLLVGNLKRSTSLPPGLFRGRQSALWATFQTAEVSTRLNQTSMGLCLDPLRLWTRNELEQSAAALLAAQTE
jgi:hypothetical protein